MSSTVLIVVSTAAAALLIRRSLRRRVVDAAPTNRPTVTNVATRPPLVVVVGLGGVGSHAAHLLLRGGVRRLRLVDFDQVSLSSLNRHATAARADVGTSKASALRRQLLRVAPDAEVEACVSLFNEAAADALLLRDSPALVLDCIDDLTTKAELLGYCLQRDLRLLCALGAGGKADACQLHVARLSEVINDPIATTMLKRMRKQLQHQQQLPSPSAEGARAAAEHGLGAGRVEGCNWWEEPAERVVCVASSEKQRVSLLPLPPSVPKEQSAELGSQPNFRVRVMPVLPPMPAAVGAALAAQALAQLGASSGDAATAGHGPPPRPVPALSAEYRRKLYQRFVQHELKVVKAAADDRRLSIDDVGLVVCDVFRCRCAISGVRFDSPERPVFALCRWDRSKPATLDNVLFVTSAAAERHEREGAQALPADLVAQIERSFAAALGGRGRPIFAACRMAEGVTE